MYPPKTKIFFVTPWFGADIPGGAEQLAYQTARQLHQAGLPVEILTTTIRDFHADWATNYHPTGQTTIDQLPVHRFPVEPRNKPLFDQINSRLLHNLPISPQEEEQFISEMIRTPQLYQFIAAQPETSLFIFIPYMFATTYFGAQIHPQQSLLIPCLHDESYAHLPSYKQLLTSVRALIFNATPEEQFTQQLLPPNTKQIRTVVGAGLDTTITGDAARFRKKYQINNRFILYAGRREPGKNTPLLLDYWQRYSHQFPSDLSLVLIGSGAINLPPNSPIIDLGFIPAADKADAFAAATLFCMPSIHESFSFVLMESWLQNVPVLVHAAGAVTRAHCQKANGGLYFNNYQEFAATLNYLLEHPDVAHQLGIQGHQYVLDNFRWDIIVQKYQSILQQVANS